MGVWDQTRQQRIRRVPNTDTITSLKHFEARRFPAGFVLPMLVIKEILPGHRVNNNVQRLKEMPSDKAGLLDP